MGTLGNNRYKLLCVDDDDRTDTVMGERKQRQTDAQKIEKKKRGNHNNAVDHFGDKNTGAIKKGAQSKMGAYPKMNAKGDGSCLKPERIKIRSMKIENKKYELEQQLFEQQLTQRKQQKQQHKQQQQAWQQRQEQQQYSKEQTFRTGRIISNSNNYKGANGKVVKTKLDRHSGSEKTGIKAVDKRNGGGAHNWGCPLTDLEELKLAMKSAKISDKGDTLQEQPVSDTPEEDDSKYITVEQWRSMTTERVKPTFNIRKPGEGEANKPDWKKMVVLQKKKPAKKNSVNGLEYDASLYPQRVGRLQRVVDIEYKFKDDRRRAWWGRSPNPSKSECTTDVINMDDEIEFPTLN